MAWQDGYRSKTMSARDALRHVRSGDRVYIHPGCAEPEVLVEALIERAPQVRDVEIVHLLTLGRADYTPILLSEIEDLFESGQMPIDVALIQVSPPDAHGFCSFGVSVDTTLTAARTARHVIAQVNDRMPRTYGDSFIHISDLAAVVEVSRPLRELPRTEITDLHRAIGGHVAGLIEDGATLQLGVGSIPDAILVHLHNHKDLGIHTEMLSDNAIALIESGVVNGRRKTFHPRKVVLGFVLGSKPLFDFVHENPIFEFHPTSYTNNSFLIAQNERMVAINSALQVDITGQVCADSIGTYFYSGIGGQVDFIRGAARSKGGKPIIALPSTAKNETISRIVPMLSPGAGVVTSRGTVHYVVTEYGVAYLHGRSIRQRAEALIQIAHPKFREELYEYCERTRWLQRPVAARGRSQEEPEFAIAGAEKASRG